jgi:NAD(P)-dependent dehydrogenase (short-subunit alcohol dehydrogenase family)
MQQVLQGRRILLTGISRGVGLAIARRFLPEGAEILGVARDPGRLETARRELEALAPGKLTTLVADLGEPGIEAVVSHAVEERWGALDVLFNNAAVMLDPDGTSGLLDQPPGILERSLDINLWSPFRLTRALVPALLRGNEPRVVHVSSGAGSMAGMREPGIASYRLSKWALNGLTMLLAGELKGRVAVSAFDPGWVKTDMGGPDAPGSPVESAEGALALVAAPFGETGKFWKDGQRIPY